jgi:hypothetical protein
MNLYRRLVPLAALALACMLSCNGCKSKQSNASGTGTAQNPQPAASTQPGAPASGAQSASAPSQPAPPPPPAVVNLPAGTRIPVRLDVDLGSKISQPGDTFRATVADDVLVNGQVVILRGARAEGTVIDAKPLGRFKGGAYLAIRLERVHTQWGSYPVSTSSIDRVEKGKGKRTGIMVGGGAGFGALVGALAGGGKGAAIGALAGGGAGTAGSAFTGNKQIFLPAETLLHFRLENPVRITEQN